MSERGGVLKIHHKTTFSFSELCVIPENFHLPSHKLLVKLMPGFY
jgi:hypothetical protein